jgi:Cof subfamily protein (haloacid dehalogenase superfamily)
MLRSPGDLPLSENQQSKLSLAKADRRTCDLVVIDVDGTLLTSQNTISAELPPLVAQAQARGIGVTLASGRPQSTMRPILAALALTLPYISAGGALMVDPATQRVLHACPLSREQMALCVEQARIAQAAVVAQTPEHLFYEGDQATWKQLAAISSIDVTGADRSKVLMTSMPDVLLACAEPMKVTICAHPGKLLAIEQALQQHPASLHLTYSSPIYLEVTQSEASKGEAVKRLAGHLGIALERILAIGDSTHDLEHVGGGGYSGSDGECL